MEKNFWANKLVGKLKLLVNYSISIVVSLITFVLFELFFWFKKFLMQKKLAHHFLSNYFLKKNFFSKWPWHLIFGKKVSDFFSKKIYLNYLHYFCILKKILTLAKIYRNPLIIEFKYFVKLNLIRSLAKLISTI